jgi:hypothetical protein
MHLQQISKQPMEQHKDKVSQIKETKMRDDIYHPKDTSPHNDTTSTKVAQRGEKHFSASQPGNNIASSN